MQCLPGQDKILGPIRHDSLAQFHFFAYFNKIPKTPAALHRHIPAP
jgi:hypothetical protein